MGAIVPGAEGNHANVIVSCAMKSLHRPLLALAALLAVSTMLAVFAPMTMANATQAVVTSSRSFPKTTTVRRNLLAESTSVSVDGSWTGIESLSVPKTKSTKEKEAELKAAQEKAKQEKAAQEAADQAAASRSEDRQSLSTTSGSSASSSSSASTTTSANGSAVAQYAIQYLGSPYVYGGATPSGWDCSGFVMYVFAHYGVSLAHSSGAQATAGTAVSSLADAQPGDILANGTHAAIYIGNGLVVNALNPTKGTVISSVSIAFDSAYSIRRVL